jgi:hypothetical protein
VQQQLQQLDVGATFTTTRTRPAVIAGITTFFFLWMVATDSFAYGDTWTADRGAELFVNLIELLLLLAAVRPVAVRTAIMGFGRRWIEHDL